MRQLLLLACLSLTSLAAPATVALAQDSTTALTRADTLRGSIGPQRAWWDVAFYDLRVAVQPADSSVRGQVGITYRVVAPGQEMQIDLKQPLEIDSILQRGKPLAYRRDGDAFFVTLLDPQKTGDRNTVAVHYHGKPRAAQHAPWDGGFVWGRDSLGAPWVASAVQGFGASAWWPNKDTQADEPDSQRVAVTVPTGMIDVSNGRLRSTTRNAGGTTTYEWFVKNPINNYDVAVNAGSYTHFGDVYDGESGKLTLDFWPLSYHLAPAKRQFAQVKPMLQCFEHWFGPYPWYEDGYKLVETPHLGMEHQSAVAYGNHYLNGYLGQDLSGTGLGLKWDFIIIHESAHEWFGNSITSRDLADMWVHESFANYAEGIYTECQQGKAAGEAYIVGTRKAVANDKPIIAPFGVNKEGSGDMYYKGGNMLHTIRQIVNDDEKWRGILRGMNATFRHQIVTGDQVRQFFSDRSGVDLSTVFAQYLTTTKIPALEYRVTGQGVGYRWADVVPGFTMPVRVSIGGRETVLRPSESWQTIDAPAGATPTVVVNPNYYVLARDVNAPVATPASTAPKSP
jgi:aminopeptidase N